MQILQEETDPFSLNRWDFSERDPPLDYEISDIYERLIRVSQQIRRWRT